METVKRNYIALISTSLTVLTLILCAVFAVYGYHQGIFESRDTLVAFISQAGIWGPAFFIFIQAIQVVIPILPGFVTCIVGAIVFSDLFPDFSTAIPECVSVLYWLFTLPVASEQDW